MLQYYLFSMQVLPVVKSKLREDTAGSNIPEDELVPNADCEFT